MADPLRKNNEYGFRSVSGRQRSFVATFEQTVDFSYHDLGSKSAYMWISVSNQRIVVHTIDGMGRSAAMCDRVSLFILTLLYF